MDLVREILDEQVVDRSGRALGKVDGIVLRLRDGQPPRVLDIEIGAVTLARRLHPALARWLRLLMQRWGAGNGEPLRSPIEALGRVREDLSLDVDAEQTPAYAWERWLRRHVIGRIPGSGV